MRGRRELELSIQIIVGFPHTEPLQQNLGFSRLQNPTLTHDWTHFSV